MTHLNVGERVAGGSKSKNKGSAYERDLCKFLGETFGGVFIRSTNSGAFLGGKNAGRKAGLSETQIAGQRGDIVPPAHVPKLVIEAKAYKEFRFHQLIQPEACAQLDTWMKQAQDACDPGDVSLICFKINNRGAFVLLAGDVADRCAIENHARYTGVHGSGVVTDLKSFFSTNKDALLRLCAAV